MLDPRLLRAFIAIVDAGSFTLASERLHMTQSTISQQLARLEEAVGSALIERSARPVVPIAAGERLLGYARRLLALQQEAEAALGDPAGTASIRIGVPEDIVDVAMAKTFSDFARRHREIRLDVTAGLSRELTRRFRGGEFDIAIVKESEPGPDCRVAYPEPVAWFEGIDAPGELPDPLPLVAFQPGGLYREAMFERIEREQRRWYIAFAASSLHNVLVAVEAGLGLSLLPVSATQDYRVRPYVPFGTEPAMVVALYSRESDGAVSELVGSMQAVLAARVVANPGQFRSGREFAAWLGLTPSQNSSGGKDRLGRITKMGDRYLRKLLVIGATSLIRRARHKPEAADPRLLALLARKPARVASVAMANKMARVVWAVMACGETYQARHAPTLAA